MTYDAAGLRQGVLISDTARQFGVALNKRGREFWACCPFHKEDTASFSIYPAKAGGERFWCYGCGEHGDVIQFVQSIKGVDFKAACSILGGEREAGENRPAADSETVDPYAVLSPREELSHPFVVGRPSSVYNPKAGRFSTIVPTMVHPYRDKEGNLLGVVVRQVIKGQKQTPTLRPAWMDGRAIWSRWAFAEPRPLYGLDAL